jgi:hypothetical protein
MTAPGGLADVNGDFLDLNLTPALRLSSQITLSAHDTGRIDVSLANNYLTAPEPGATAFVLPASLALLIRRRRPDDHVRDDGLP